MKEKLIPILTVVAIGGAVIWFKSHNGNAQTLTMESQSLETLQAQNDGVDEIYADHLTDTVQNTKRDIKQLNQDVAQIQQAIKTLLINQKAMRKLVETSIQAKALRSPTVENQTPKLPSDDNSQRQQALSDFQRFDSSLATETVDHEWAQNTIADVEASLAHTELSGIELVDASCGSTLCRLDMSLTKDKTIEESMEKLSLHRSWQGSTTFSVDAQGNARIYFARVGHQLPTME